MSGYEGGLSDEQQRALSQFRTEMSSFRDQPSERDHYYLRWLRARKFNVAKALDMYKKHLKWRKEWKVDTTVQEYSPPEVLKRYFPCGMMGEDRDGHPLNYEFFGNLDFKGLHRAVRREEVLRTRFRYSELIEQKLAEFSRKKGRNIDTITTILNLENLSYHRQYHWPGIQLMREIFSTVSENYPETTKTILIINAPKIFPVAYNLFKNFVDARTRQKLVILGDNWQEGLREYVAPDQLPQAYGGTLCDPDPQCSAHLNWGGDIPEELFLTNLTQTNKSDMEYVLIGSSSKHTQELNVEEPGTVIRWEFLTNDHDIGFGLVLRQGGQDTVLLETQRKNCHVIPENGMHQCETAGTYVLIFDNSYSWTRSKELFLSVQKLAPDMEISQSYQAASHTKECNGMAALSKELDTVVTLQPRSC